MQDADDNLDGNELGAQQPGLRSLDEILALVDAAEATSEDERARNVALVQMLVYTHLGIAGAVALDVSEIDWKRYVFRDANIDHVVPFNDLVADALEHYLLQRTRLDLMHEPGLFLNRRGTRLSVWAMEQLLNELEAAAGVGWVVASASA